MLRVWLAVAGGDSESATCTVKLAVPVAVGVPEMFPLLGSIESPAGRLPLMTLQV